jgi:two-component system LytT family response regulator
MDTKEKNMKVIIVDDEKNARLALRGVLEQEFTDIEVMDECKDVPSALLSIKKNQPELVFLDISMPGYSGLEFFQFFNKEEINFHVVFVTAHQDYAFEAYELEAIDYILKPIRIDAVRRDITKHNRLVQKDDSDKEYLDDNKFALQTGDGLQFFLFDDILYLKADGAYTHFFLKDGNKITVSRKLSDFMILEKNGPFIRIHRSHMVNINNIKKFIKTDGGFVLMNNDEELSVANDKKEMLLGKITTLKV